MRLRFIRIPLDVVVFKGLLECLLEFLYAYIYFLGGDGQRRDEAHRLIDGGIEQ